MISTTFKDRFKEFALDFETPSGRIEYGIFNKGYELLLSEIDKQVAEERKEILSALQTSKAFITNYADPFLETHIKLLCELDYLISKYSEEK